MEHPKWGPQVRDWQERRIISRNAKLAALTTMAIGVGITWFTIGHPWVWISVAVIVIAGGWIATRSEGLTAPDTPLTIRPAREADLAEASELCLRSKAHWGYDAAFIAACREELTLTPADLAGGHVELAYDGETMVGVMHLILEGDQAHLEKLFIEPHAIGGGIGGALFAHTRELASQSGARIMHVTADPQATGFYKRMGFEQVGEEPSGSIPGRVLPVMTLDLRCAG